jgi:thioredoxin 1
MKKLLYFSTPECGPCKVFKPVMEQVANQVPVTFINANTSQMSSEYGILSVPTVLLMENGIEKSRFIGARPLEQVLNFYHNG